MRNKNSYMDDLNMKVKINTPFSQYNSQTFEATKAFRRQRVFDGRGFVNKEIHNGYHCKTPDGIMYFQKSEVIVIK